MNKRYTTALKNLFKDTFYSVESVKYLDIEFSSPKLNILLFIDESILIADKLLDNTIEQKVANLAGTPLQSGVHLPDDFPAGKIEVLFHFYDVYTKDRIKITSFKV